MWRMAEVGFQLIENKVLFSKNDFHNNEEEKEAYIIMGF